MFRVWGLGFKVWGVGFKVYDLGFMVWGLEVTLHKTLVNDFNKHLNKSFKVLFKML